MKRFLTALAISGTLALPALAQDPASVACADYMAMDNAGQMAMLAELESMNSEMATSQEMSSEQIHEALTADCTAHPEMMVMEVYEAKMSN